VTLLAALAIIAGSSAGLLLLLLAVGGLLALPYLNQRVSVASDKRASARHTTRRFGSAHPAPHIDIIMPDDSIQAAQVVPLKHTEGYKFVLTSKGYMLVNDQDRAVHVF
jgi:hypothetical protein